MQGITTKPESQSLEATIGTIIMVANKEEQLKYQYRFKTNSINIKAILKNFN